jgi:hypothetical protein
MAKKPEAPEPEKVNKSQAIRDAITQNPDKSPAGVAQLLTEKGIDVTPQYVSTIKSKMGAGGKKEKKASPKITSSGPSLNSVLSFVSECGGLSQAQEILKNLEALKASL